MAKSLSAIPSNYDSFNEKEARRSGWDPQLEVPVVEMLGYDEQGGTAQLNRVGVSSVGGRGYLMVSGSAGGGSVTLANDAGSNRVSTFSQDAGTMRVSSIGGSVTTAPLSADSSTVSAKSGDANQLHVSSVQGDAALLRVSAIGGTAGDNVIVDGTTQTISATLTPVSAKPAGTVQGLVTNINSYDASQAHISAYQGGTWSVSALLMGSTSNIGLVSGVVGDANQFHVSALNNGSATNFLVSAVQNDAGLLHVSAIGGTAGDNVIVDGALQSISASVQRVSATVSSGTNGLITIPQNRDDAVNLRVSALSKDGGTFLVSASGGQLSATLKEGTAFIGQVSAAQSGTWAISALAKEGTSFIGNVSAKNTDATNFMVSARSGDAALLLVSTKTDSAAQFRVSAFVDSGSVSAKSTDAGTFLVSAKQGDAALLRTSAWIFDGEYSAAPNVIVSATTVPATSAMKSILATVVSLSAGTMHVSGYSGDGNQFHVSAVQGDAALQRVSAIVDNGSISAKSSDAGTMHVSGYVGDGAQFHVSATNPSASLFLVSAYNTASATNFLVSSVQNDAALQRTSAIQGDAGLLRVSADVFADTTGNLTIFRSISLSASQTVKSTAGALYGYFLANTDTKFNYVKFYNTSGAINVGTDTPMLTIPIPPSAGANVEFQHGLVGFTNGIGIVALSAIADNATTSSPASAVIGNIFYK